MEVRNRLEIEAHLVESDNERSLSVSEHAERFESLLFETVLYEDQLDQYQDGR